MTLEQGQREDIIVAEPELGCDAASTVSTRRTGFNSRYMVQPGRLPAMKCTSSQTSAAMTIKLST